jgi:protein-disulfide isomerase-like protein with CxxC motif
VKLEITDLQRVDLQPGDRLAVRLKGRATDQQAAAVTAIVREWSGGDFPVLVLYDDTALEVVTASGDAREITR